MYYEIPKESKVVVGSVVVGVGCTMVNAYMIMMRRFCELTGLPVWYDHHEFNKNIGYALIDPATEWKTRHRNPIKVTLQRRRRRFVHEKTGKHNLVIGILK